MGKGIRYSDEFKQEAVNQVVVHGYCVADVAARLDISTESLYGWIKSLSKPTWQRKEDEDLRREVARLRVFKSIANDEIVDDKVLKTLVSVKEIK